MLMGSAFTTTMYHDNMRLIVRTTKTVDWSDTFMAPIRTTFSPGAWFWTIAVVLGTGVLMSVVEEDAGDAADQVIKVIREQRSTATGPRALERSSSTAEAAARTVIRAKRAVLKSGFYGECLHHEMHTGFRRGELIDFV